MHTVMDCLRASALALCLGAVPAHAAMVFAPLPGLNLNPGDSYRYISTTGGLRTQATSTDISTYDAFVNGVADASSLGIDGITWYALASTATQSAASQAALSGDTPIYLLDGTVIASSNADLFDGALAAGIEVRLNGDSTPVDTETWTGSDASGAISNPLGGSFPNYGISPNTGSEWMFSGRRGGSTQYSLYALSETLTVPAGTAPIASSLSLLGPALLALAVSARRRRGSTAR